MYIGLGIVLIVLGAIIAFALQDADIPFFEDGTLGYILMAAGLLAILLSFAFRRRATGITTTRESQVDPATGSRVDRTDIDPR